VRGLSIREIHRRTGLHRDTISHWLRSDDPPVYRREPAGSKLDPFKPEMQRLLHADPKISSQRIQELIAALGFEGGKTIVDDYVCEGAAAVRCAAHLSAHRLSAGGDLSV
jgi:transposase